MFFSSGSAPDQNHVGRILVVDDDAAIAELTARILTDVGFSVRVCTDPTLVEAIADPDPPDLIITDLSMPHRGGIELLELISRRYPETGAIVLTGMAEIGSAVQAMKLGALDYVVKPFGVDLLATAVFNALRKHRIDVQQRRAARELEATVAAQQDTISRLQQSLAHASEGTLLALTTALDARENATRGHCERVSYYSVAIAECARFPTGEIEMIRVGSLLHDVGKIGIPDRILQKPGSLSSDEWDVMRTHPGVGFRILEPLTHLRAPAELVISHHERWDGGGYPNRLPRTQIPLGGRVFAIADAFDAMTTDRCYRPRMAMETALERIRQGAGTQFDPELARVFIENARRIVRETSDMA